MHAFQHTPPPLGQSRFLGRNGDSHSRLLQLVQSLEAAMGSFRKYTPAHK
jgi:hypothetical protein